MINKFKPETLDCIGKKFERLGVLGFTKKFNRTYFDCLCDCGVRKAVKISHIKSGATRSCGCLNKDLLKLRKGEVKTNLIKPNNHSAKHHVYLQYKKGAEDRDYDFNLTFEDVVEITSQNCYYCGDSATNRCYRSRGHSVYHYNGIDRKDNTVGYEKENCVPCCRTCNKAKHSLTLKEVQDWIQRLMNFQLKEKK
jgi:hypothetical protein